MPNYLISSPFSFAPTIEKLIVMEFILNNKLSPTADALIVPIAQGPTLQQALAAVSETTNLPAAMLEADFKGGLKDIHLAYFAQNGQTKRLYLLGLGEAPRSIDVLNAFRTLVFRRKAGLPAHAVVSFLHGNAPDPAANWVEPAVNGMLLGNYDIGLYKTEKNGEGQAVALEKVEVAIEAVHHAAASNAIETGVAIGETHASIFDLVNAPANKKTPKTLGDWAISSSQKYGYTAKVLSQREILELGLHALLAVNRGSENPPAFIVMEYLPTGVAPLKKIGLVGKGVTFDTGGISLKPSTNMHYMKSDMGGAAAVLGLMEVAAKLQFPFHLMGVIPATENSIDSLSVKPGDVIGSYQGKTIEVIDTDAEGRLILADGLTYVARNFQPDVMVDLATLTGSCIRTLGTYAGGLFSNNDTLSAQLLESCDRTGERLWRLPLWDEYRKELKSDVADVKNFSGSPSAGAITAAKFLQEFIEKHPAWAHMDIAGVAVGDSEYASQKSATGFGIRLLVDFMKGQQAT